MSGPRQKGPIGISPGSEIELGSNCLRSRNPPSDLGVILARDHLDLQSDLGQPTNQHLWQQTNKQGILLYGATWQMEVGCIRVGRGSVQNGPPTRTNQQQHIRQRRKRCWKELSQPWGEWPPRARGERASRAQYTERGQDRNSYKYQANSSLNG